MKKRRIWAAALAGGMLLAGGALAEPAEIPQAVADVMLGNARAANMSARLRMTIEEIRRTESEKWARAWTFAHFAAADMDGDGVCEVVIEGEPGGAEAVLILHAAEDEVCAYIAPQTAVTQVKTDGSFAYRRAPSDWGIARVQFPEKEWTQTVSACCAPKRPSGKIGYWVNGQEAEKRAFDEAAEAQREKPDAAWRAFTPENIVAMTESGEAGQ